MVRYFEEYGKVRFASFYKVFSTTSGNNRERIETRKTGVERKTFLNGDGATSKEREDKTRERQSKRLGTETESHEKSTRKKAKQRKETETYIGRRDASLASLSLLFVFTMQPSLR